MLSKSDEYWASVRQVPLTKKESTMDLFVNRLEQIPGFKYIIFGAKALIENFVETSGKGRPNKFDIGPINTMISSNYRRNPFPVEWYDDRKPQSTLVP